MHLVKLACQVSLKCLIPRIGHVATQVHFAPKSPAPCHRARLETSERHMEQLLDDYLTRDELAAQLGKSPRTIQRWDRLRIGPVPTVIGNSKVFRRADVQKWLDAQRREPTPARQDAQKRIGRKTGRR